MPPTSAQEQCFATNQLISWIWTDICENLTIENNRKNCFVRIENCQCDSQVTTGDVPMSVADLRDGVYLGSARNGGSGILETEPKTVIFLDFYDCYQSNFCPPQARKFWSFYRCSRGEKYRFRAPQARKFWTFPVSLDHCQSAWKQHWGGWLT